ncbi:unnamed protein product [Closterium sp. NIES-54]
MSRARKRKAGYEQAEQEEQDEPWGVVRRTCVLKAPHAIREHDHPHHVHRPPRGARHVGQRRVLVVLGRRTLTWHGTRQAGRAGRVWGEQRVRNGGTAKERVGVTEHQDGSKDGTRVGRVEKRRSGMKVHSQAEGRDARENGGDEISEVTRRASECEKRNRGRQCATPDGSASAN